MTVDKRWYEGALADTLEKLREEARRKRRLVYDCDKAQVFGQRVVCSKGLPLSSAKDGGVPLARVLAGVTTAKCQNCRHWHSNRPAETAKEKKMK